MKSLPIIQGSVYENIVFDETLIKELLTNVKYFEYTTMPFFHGIMDKSYDSVSWFTHDDGKSYAVIHTIFGQDYETT